MRQFRIEALLALALLLTSLAASAELQVPTTATLHQVGAGTLRWFGFHVYDASTWAERAPLPADGSLPTPFALQITYARDISASDLVEATKTSWNDLGLLDEQALRWLPELIKLWPNVKAGDTLVLLVDTEGKTAFYYNKRFLGHVDDAAFATRFAAIWLHPNSSEPDLRKQLLGGTS